jgi:YHS domain-containing protein
MARVILLVVLLAFVIQSVYRVWRGVREGLGTSTERGTAKVTGRMVRDPICGTFVLPERALSLDVGRQQHYFCSAACRDKYRARTA